MGAASIRLFLAHFVPRPVPQSVILSAALLLASACAPAVPTPSSPAVGTANPASVACVERGGRLEIRTRLEGEYGVCRLPDGQACEEWALFRENAAHYRSDAGAFRVF